MPGAMDEMDNIRCLFLIVCQSAYKQISEECLVHPAACPSARCWSLDAVALSLGHYPLVLMSSLGVMFITPLSGDYVKMGVSSDYFQTGTGAPW